MSLNLPFKSFGTHFTWNLLEESLNITGNLNESLHSLHLDDLSYVLHGSDSKTGIHSDGVEEFNIYPEEQISQYLVVWLNTEHEEDIS